MPTTERRPLMAGNWKMNLNHLEAIRLVQDLAFRLLDTDHEAVEIVVIPPFTALRSVQTFVDGDHLAIRYGAQDVSAFDSGAYTGEVSASMLAKLDCAYVVVGHSERRQFHAESDDLVNAKAKAALRNDITPIVCVGEALDVRQAGNQVAHVLAQLDASLAGLTAEQVAGSVVAYEPVWAIGTGEVATPADAQEVCGAIRNRVAETWDAATAADLRILYGGSVKGDNAAGIMAQPDVDGGLVGGASLQADEFVRIVRYREAGSTA